MIEVIELEEYHLDTKAIFDIAKRIEKGATIIFPTDSVMALGCLMSNKKGIERILKATNKKAKHSKLALICKDIKEVSQFTKHFSNDVFKTMNRYLPGPYTFILNADKSVRKYFDNSKSEIGIRIPDQPIIHKLLELLPEPLISTSLTKSDGVHYKDSNDIASDFIHSVDIFINSGQLFNGESTILNCVNRDIEVIREGIGKL